MFFGFKAILGHGVVAQNKGMSESNRNKSNRIAFRLDLYKSNLITKYGNKYSGVWYNVAYQRRQSNLERIGCPRSACYESLFVSEPSTNILSSPRYGGI